MLLIGSRFVRRSNDICCGVIGTFIDDDGFAFAAFQDSLVAFV